MFHIDFIFEIKFIFISYAFRFIVLDYYFRLFFFQFLFFKYQFHFFVLVILYFIQQCVTPINLFLLLIFVLSLNTLRFFISV